MKKFVLLATQRSGTGLLASILNSHPDIHLHHEVFCDVFFREEHNFYRYWLEQIRRDESRLLRAGKRRAAREFFNSHIFSIPRGKRAIGVDIKYTEFFFIEGLRKIVLQSDVIVLHLVRKNFLKTLISEELNAIQGDLNRRAHMAQKPEPVRVHLRTDESLVALLQQRSRMVEQFRNLFRGNLPYLEVYYEDFFRDNEEEVLTIRHEPLQQILSFLDVPSPEHQLTTDLRKTNPRRLKELVDNYEEVASVLDGTPFAHLVRN